MTPRDAVAILNTQRNQLLAEAETAKSHPLSKFTLPAAEWQEMKAYLTDGGGVLDDGDLRTAVHQALLSDDQATFWPGIAHLWKTQMKVRGNVRPLASGGLVENGVRR